MNNNNNNSSKYAECHKSHSAFGGKADGCREFIPDRSNEMRCKGCLCERNFHRKLEPTVKSRTEVVYTKCHKIHDFKTQVSVDGCQRFTPSAGGNGALTCAVCGCHRGFHQTETIITSSTSEP